jgi:benzoylformate decarboxylase
MQSIERYTIQHAFHDVLRSYDMTTIFGNPGSTEQPMLKNFPSDFKYILVLQEASVVGMAAGYSEATRKPAVVSLHTSAGTGHGMGNLITAFMNKTPLIVIAGQQTREMLLGEPLLTNRDATNLPRPHVKWSYQPDRPMDIPAMLVRAIACAVQPPAGPVHLSIPMYDWDADAVYPPPKPRLVSTRIAPDPEQLEQFATRIALSKMPVLILGAEADPWLGMLRSLWQSCSMHLSSKGHSPIEQPFQKRIGFSKACCHLLVGLLHRFCPHTIL